MIGDLLFFIKMIVLSLFFVLFLQIKIGDNTLEEKIKINATNSAMIAPLQEVAQGGVKAIELAWKRLAGLVGHKFNSAFSNENAPGNRTLNINIGRSKKFISEQLESAKKTAKQTVEQSEALKTLKTEQDRLKDDLVEELKSEGFFIDEN